MSTPDSKKSESLLKPHDIRDLRERLRQNQVQFAKELGVNSAYISQIESGIRPVSSKISRAIRRLMESKAQKVNPEAPGLSYEALMMVERWTARVNNVAKLGITPAQFISLCLMANGEKFCDRIIEESNSAVDIAAAKTFRTIGQGILPQVGETGATPPRVDRPKPEAGPDSGKK